MFTDKLSAQAKAVAAGLAMLLAKIQTVVDTAGYDDLRQLTLSQWLGVATWALATYGAIYMIPNALARVRPVDPADPQI